MYLLCHIYKAHYVYMTYWQFFMYPYMCPLSLSNHFLACSMFSILVMSRKALPPFFNCNILFTSYAITISCVRIGMLLGDIAIASFYSFQKFCITIYILFTPIDKILSTKLLYTNTLLDLVHQSYIQDDTYCRI
jgi:hypothetical protein